MPVSTLQPDHWPDQRSAGRCGGVTFAALAQKLPQRTWLVGATGLYASALLGLYVSQPGSILAVGVSFLAGSMLSVMFAVPYTAFYSRTPQELLGRVGSLGAAYGSLIGALASLGFGRLMHTVSAPHRATGMRPVHGWSRDRLGLHAVHAITGRSS